MNGYTVLSLPVLSKHGISRGSLDKSLVSYVDYSISRIWDYKASIVHFSWLSMNRLMLALSVKLLTFYITI